ncbi:hypothetical protein ZYGR_0H00910 [Zygosaccharomyces rouxii]|uniref:ZYRO0B06050p n=2 Tax=Zygosaccharomyces rouxii TaxID=4956 RepID=C5DR71_ZYGRC|nr:uncharacterized protein ZYRO0B06050g [Zygosaccharomyces rouxii]GAV47250.1 hypothetical protein ZYGR_0H00910 [Zygosaccharomyces rouxii]CAR26282.1 ZYRO0B06050p [Zygosaccharomyces rouxii]
MDDSKSFEEKSDESMDSSESDEEGLVPLQRPVFLKRPGRQQGDDDDRDVKRRQTPMQVVERENQSLKAREDAQQLIGTNYSSEQDMVRRALTLDDDDSRDPELEKQLWFQRQEARSRARRDRLVAQQLEWEAYEHNRQQGSKQLNTTPAPAPTPAPASSSFTRTSNNDNRHFKPERVRDTTFGASKNSTQDTEYSIL